MEATGHRTAPHWWEGSIRIRRGTTKVVCKKWHDFYGMQLVVQIYRHDAHAYCKWLAGKTRHIVRLPMKTEWQKAARGTDERMYAWGDEFDKDKWNSRESGIGDSTPGGKYSPQGDSPYSVADMAGNAWLACPDRANTRRPRRLRQAPARQYVIGSAPPGVLPNIH